ncbi:kinase-like domain-containing protein [Tanacetum coccineum]
MRRSRSLLTIHQCPEMKKRNNQPSQSSGNERFLKVSYNQLLKATDGFSTSNLIGEGGFNSVYKGILDSDDDKFVAVKVLHLQNRGAHRSFLAECEAWRNIRHLYVEWKCARLASFKCKSSKLNLLQRINILRDVATALDYLHIRCQTMIVHGDLKHYLNQNNSTGVKGTIGYAPPEHGTGSEMTSIDVIDGDAIVLQSTEANAKKVEECLTATIKIGLSCSVDSPPQRMKIEIVVIELQCILDVLKNIKGLIPSLHCEVESNCNKEQCM